VKLSYPNKSSSHCTLMESTFATCPSTIIAVIFNPSLSLILFRTLFCPLVVIFLNGFPAFFLVFATEARVSGLWPLSFTSTTTYQAGYYLTCICINLHLSNMYLYQHINYKNLKNLKNRKTRKNTCNQV
jgi:hypothetical protein